MPRHVTAKKRPRRKLAGPPTIYLPYEGDSWTAIPENPTISGKVVITKKHGLFYLKYSIASKVRFTLITHEEGIESITSVVLGRQKNGARGELMQQCEKTLAEIIRSKNYSSRRSVQRRVADEMRDQEFTYAVMRRIRAANFKRGARAEAIREEIDRYGIEDTRSAEKILRRHKARDPVLQGKIVDDTTRF